ncbi:MAG: transcription antitermination factor NusB [Microscillaceae bacterium]|nr:transcription antitermination factor NusB [Microscillaceae bacterium]MDW8459627.1 transcription antitermination factor NusB [Cytophagales bacterium]
MLNRHLLRGKAMQTLYSLEHSQRAAYSIAIDLIQHSLEPAWNVDKSTVDFEEIAKKRQSAQDILERNYQNDTIRFDASVHPDVKKIALEAFTFYKNQLSKDYNFLSKQLESQFNKMYDAYLMLLLLLIDLSDFARQEEIRIKKSLAYQNQVIVLEGDFKLKNNQFCEVLRQSQPLQKEILKRNLSWNNYREIVHNLFRQVIRNEEFYKQYDQAPTTDFEQDRTFITELLRQVILKNESIQTVLEEIDPHWVENAAIVRDMLNKNLKKTTPNFFELTPLALNWEEDFLFVKEILHLTWKHQLELERIIDQKVENWELERLAQLDRIIIRMAICEMLHFPSIPVKVTINEYIELSKRYSTPKSKQFVNGLLDAISQDLLQQGKIRKTGRGLIDNK